MIIFSNVLCGEESTINKDNKYYNIYHAALKVKNNQNSGIRDLMKFSLGKHEKELSQELVKSMVLGMIEAKSKHLSAYIKKIEAHLLVFLEEKPLKINCNKCDGKKFTTRKCRKCKNGECYNCKGTGEISYPGLNGQIIRKPCNTCNQSKKCPVCKGTQIENVDCYACNKTGRVFNKGAVPGEFKKSIKKILSLTPNMAFNQGLYIGVGENKIELAKLENKAAKKRLKLRKERDIGERKIELALIEKKKRTLEELNENKSIVPVNLAGEKQKTLLHAVLEVKNYINAQERRTKSNLYNKASGRFENSMPTLQMEISQELMNKEKSLRNQILNGFKKFWVLRARQNGLRGKAQIEFSYQNEKINLY